MSIKITLFNSLSNKNETLTTIEPNHLKMYVCGPTVYDRPHLGNARSAVIYDLFFRFFKEVFEKVTYVRNITDVDDKINLAAKEGGISIQELTTKITDFFYQDIDALQVLRPTFEPKATEHISEMIEIIQKLIANGFAYKNDGHVLFDVTAYKEYGKLSNRQLDEMIAGARIEIAGYKKNPLDFVLWKPADKEDDISSIFESPWGKGRPGWHIECSAMSSKYLGNDFDFHGGGADLKFPHHENEIAQSVCANQGSHFARFWVHNGFLTVNGEKMSKSLKNFITVRDLLNKGVNGVVIRYFLLSSHYHKPLDFNEKAIQDAAKTIDKFNSILDQEIIEDSVKLKPSEHILNLLADDLNISKVIAYLHESFKKIKESDDKALKRLFARELAFLGFLYQSEKNFSLVLSEEDENFINDQIALRIKAKQEKDFIIADKIRNDLLSRGIVLEDVARDKTLWKQLLN